MPDDDPIGDLLLQWQLQRERGMPVSVERLCVNHPHLLDEVRRRVQALEKMGWLDEDFALLHQTDADLESSIFSDSNTGTLTLDQLFERLVQNELLTRAQIDEEIDLWFGGEPPDAVEFAQHLVERSLITLFQSQALFWNFPKKLLIGEYQILDRIGSGGMGFVFKAVHRPMRRTVALKVLREEVQGLANSLWRFQREFRVAGRLIHPNIVTAFDAGQDDGMHYLVMEYIKGDNLSDRVAQRGPLDWRTAVDYVWQAAKGLACAHEHGLIHRDVKPGNLLVNQHGNVKILDLGMARPNESHDPNDDSSLRDLSGTETLPDTHITQTGTVFGTIAYMAPEQRRDIRSADERSDIYSLGCTLYFLLTGQTIHGPIADVAPRLQFADVPPPNLRTKVPDAPQALNRVFQKMAALDPKDRYQTMAEVVNALAPLRPRKVLGFPDRLWRLLLVVIAIVALVLIGGLLSWNLYRQNTGRSLSRKVETASAQELANLIPELSAGRDWVLPELRTIFADQDDALSRSQAVSLAILTLEEEIDPHVLHSIVKSGAEESAELRSYFQHADVLKKRLWNLCVNESADREHRLDAACVLAEVETDVQAWIVHCAALTGLLFRCTEEELDRRARHFRNITQHLFSTLLSLFHSQDPVERLGAARVLARLGCEPRQWADLVCQADGEQFQALKACTPVPLVAALDALRNELTESPQDATGSDDEQSRKVHAAAALAHFGETRHIRAILDHSADPTLRTWLIRVLADTRPPMSFLTTCLAETEQQPHVLQGLLLSLGKRSVTDLTENEREELLLQVKNLYKNHPSAAVHAAAEWVLRQWDARLPPLNCSDFEDREWCVNRFGLTLVRIVGPVHFEMGSHLELENPLRGFDENRHAQTISHSFAIAAHETTMAMFQEFLSEVPLEKFSSKVVETDLPRTHVNWYHAAAFCRWLSEKEKIDESQMCFPRIEEIRSGVRLPDDYLTRTGYRLPTEAEWEYACKANTTTPWSFGSNLTFARDYAWYDDPGSRAQPVSRKQPNPFGLFDVHGNVAEWCMDVYTEYPLRGREIVESLQVHDSDLRIFRGGCYRHNSRAIRSANRNAKSPWETSDRIGFRLARTLPPVECTGSRSGK